jgi:GTPase SAR1 family protein
MDDVNYVCKIIIVGDSGVGKSNLLLRYKTNQFDPFMKNTIGVDFFQIDRTTKGLTVRNLTFVMILI